MAGPLGAAPTILVGAAVGGAAAAALEPVFEPARQQAWLNAPNRLLGPPILARLIAQGGVPLDDAAKADAAREGYSEDKLRALLYLEQTVPGVGEALRILRRDPTFAPLFKHSLVKQAIDPDYFAGLTDLANEKLDPAVIAVAIVRGILEDPGFLPVGPPTTVGNVQAFPTSPIDALKEAAAAGWDRDRLFVQTAISGRPMSPEEAVSGVFRGILQRPDYDRAIAEGDIRNEWADAIFEVARQIPSVADYVRANIKGWIDTKALHDGAALHGMSSADADLLYLAAGRPAAPQQMATAVARGVDGPDGTTMDKAQFLKGIRESDIRPEWGEMLWGIRYQYPALFQLNNLVKSGAITGDQAATWAEKDRYAPEVVTALRASWNATNNATTVDARVKSAQTQAVTAVKRQYLREKIPGEEAVAYLEEIGISNANATEIVRYWAIELQVTERLLTPAQIKKAYRENLKTLDEATSELVAQHYSVGDAGLFLQT